MNDFEKLPSGAKPNCNPHICTINPYDKAKRQKGLNYKEYSDFSGICALSNEQIIQCYSWLDKDMIKEEFVLRCFECPYAKNVSRFTELHNTNKYPYYIESLIELEWDNPKSFVYFISDGEYVKIGVGVNPEKRMSELQTGNARELQLICKIPVKTEKDAFALENRLHQEYSAFSKNGEWFNILDHIVVKEFSQLFS